MFNKLYFIILLLLLNINKLICEITLLPHGNFYALINFIKPYLPDNPIIVEAGAYCGEQSTIMSKFWPNSTIHAFEPVPIIYKKLIKNTAKYNNIHCYELALSDKNGSAEFYISQDPRNFYFPGQSNSLLYPKEHFNYSDNTFKKKINVKTITLDSWAIENKISYIDFIWLNIQGFELNVLMASPNILKKIKILAIEVEFVEIYKNQYLYERIQSWLLSQNFNQIAMNFDSIKKYWFGDVVFINNQSLN